MAVKIDWKKHFDAVYCLSLASNVKRREDMEKELRRVGIAQSRLLKMKITVKNAFYKHIWSNPDFPTERWWIHNSSALNATMGHYEIMKECLDLGYERVLIMEDDIRFLKDIAAVKSIIDAMPKSDIVLLDKFIPISKEQYLNSLETEKINDYFSDFSKVKIWGVSCYAVTKKAMEVMTRNQELRYVPADHVTNRVDNHGRVVNDDGLTRAAAIKNLAMQDFSYKERLNDHDKIAYERLVKLEDYNL